MQVRGQKVPWLTREVKQLMNVRDHFHNLALRTKNELHWSSNKRLRNVMTLKLRKEKQGYFMNSSGRQKEIPVGPGKT